ncbi:MAG: hypothetical protein ACRC7N_16455 [Clostridium sp.]
MGIWIFVLSLIGAVVAFIQNDTSTIGMAIYIAITILFINIAMGNIAEVIRRTCSPDTVYYNRTSELIQTKIFWSVGIHVGAVFLGTIFGLGILVRFNWWQILLVLILALVIALISGAMNQQE